MVGRLWREEVNIELTRERPMPSYRRESMTGLTERRHTRKAKGRMKSRAKAIWGKTKKVIPKRERVLAKF